MQKDADAPPGAATRNVHLIGDPHAIAQAKYLIQLKVDENNRGPMGGMPMGGMPMGGMPMMGYGAAPNPYFNPYAMAQPY
eukprot:COSAG01_NODE_41271_length_453_cov_1.983051_2_plen_79_part_01